MKAFLLDTCYLAGLFTVLSALLLLAEQLESPLGTLILFVSSIYTMVLIMVRFESGEERPPDTSRAPRQTSTKATSSGTSTVSMGERKHS